MKRQSKIQFFKAFARMEGIFRVVVVFGSVVAAVAISILGNRLTTIWAAVDAAPDKQTKDLLETALHTTWDTILWLVAIQVLFAVAVVFLPNKLGSALSMLEETEELADAELARKDGEIRRQLKEIASSEAETDRYFSTLFASSQGLAALRAILSQEDYPKADDAIEGHISAILSDFFGEEALLEIFRYADQHSLHNAAIYLRDPEEGTLKSIWRIHHPSMLTNGKGRDWKIGEGHVGQCFVSGEMKFCADMQAAGLVSDERDIRQYRSAASVPLFAGDEVVGVFVVTSNQANQFGYFADDGIFRSEDFQPVLEIIGSLLSVYFMYTQWCRKVKNAAAKG